MNIVIWILQYFTYEYYFYKRIFNAIFFKISCQQNFALQCPLFSKSILLVKNELELS